MSLSFANCSMYFSRVSAVEELRKMISSLNTQLKTSKNVKENEIMEVDNEPEEKQQADDDDDDDINLFDDDDVSVFIIQYSNFLFRNCSSYPLGQHRSH